MKIPSSLIVALCCAISPALASGPLEIRFNTTATDWESQALPIGNGRMGAMIYGSPYSERMQFNDISLWTGNANLSGGYDGSQDFGYFQTFGDLYLETPGLAAPVVTNPTYADHVAPASNETIAMSADGSASTKWCVVHNNKTIIWQVAYSTPATITGYTFTSANDVAARDPRTWTFEGSNDGTNWTPLDHRALGSSFAARNTAYSFTPTSTGSYKQYRFVFTPNTAVTHFQVAEIALAGAPPVSSPTNFTRTLDVANATHRVVWSDAGVNFTRESIASYPNQVIATRFSADAPGKITTTMRLVGAHSEATTASGNELSFSGTLINGLRYATKVRVIATGGSLAASNGTLVATHCDSLVILHAAATDYAMHASTTPAFRSGIDPAIPVMNRLNSAETAGYDSIKTAHLADYHALFNRVTLDLGAPPEQTITPTRLNAYKSGGNDPHLEALLFQFGRYLLISCSRDSLPANLQGLWNNSNTPPWHGDYHVNINLQMNYWMAETANLSECHKPLFDFLGAIAPLSRAATKASFGNDKLGWTMRTSVNPFGGHGWEWDMPSSAWLARHYWEHYDFSRNTTFLQNTAWPIMKEICQFWIARLKDDGTGKLVSPQSWSPEHGPREDGVSYDQEIIWDLLTNTIAASQALDIEPTFRAQLIDIRSRLRWPGIGSWGQVMEWTTERPTLEHEGHRHTSHLYGAYPGSQFNPVDTPNYVTAAAISLEDRGTTGDSRRSWTWPWRTALWARLGNAEKAHDMIRGLLTYNTMSNLFTTHAPFQIDGNLGYPGGVGEMLLQSQAGEISVLPALPSSWQSGSFTGLRARGGFEVDATWENGVPTAVSIRSTSGGVAKVRIPGQALTPGAFVRSGGTLRAPIAENGTISFPTSEGSSYTIDTAVNGNADKDGDGFTTYQEWIAGTDPERRDSHLELKLTKEGNEWKARWPEIIGRTYVLRHSTDMSHWEDVTTRTPTTEGQADIPVANGSAGFFRLVVTIAD